MFLWVPWCLSLDSGSGDSTWLISMFICYNRSSKWTSLAEVKFLLEKLGLWSRSGSFALYISLECFWSSGILLVFEPCWYVRPHVIGWVFSVPAADMPYSFMCGDTRCRGRFWSMNRWLVWSPMGGAFRAAAYKMKGLLIICKVCSVFFLFI